LATVSIGNLSPDVTESDLHALLEPYGRPRSIKLQARRNRAFIEFKQPAVADAVVEGLRGTQLKGRTMDIAIDRPPGSGGRRNWGRRR
jgi:RNA recognition motif-containing protein